MKTNEEKIQLLNETVAYYSENTLRRCIKADFNCFYDGANNTFTASDGCAIGRLLTKELRAELDLEFKNNSVNSGVFNIFNRLPKEVQSYGKTYLLRLQNFHDNSIFWDDAGLSDYGITEVKYLISQITNNTI